MTSPRLKVAWISDFGIEWLTDLPSTLRSLPKSHPMTWQQVLLSEFERNPNLELHIVVLRKNIRENVSFEQRGTCFHVIKTPGGLRAPSMFWVDTFLIGRFLRKLRPDLVHAWGTGEKGAGLVASRLSYPYVVTIQGLLSWYKEVTPLNTYHRFIESFERRSLVRAQAVTTESTFAVRFLNQRYPGLPLHQVEHAPSWLFHGVHRSPQTKPIRFLCVGTIGHRKGTDLLLHALHRLIPEIEFELTFVGGRAEDPFLDPLRTKLPPELWSRIQFKNDLHPADVAKEMSEATMLILPTRADTSPNAVKEAVVAGVPVIASDVGGIPDYVTHGENGFLFPSENLDEFHRMLRVACQHELFSQGQVDAASLQRTRTYLSPSHMEQRFFKIYEVLAAARR